MKYVKVLLLCSIWLVAGCKDHTVYGNRQLQVQVRPLPNIQRLSVNGVFNVHIVRASRQKIKIKAESNILPLILTKVKNGRLTVKLKPDVNISTHYPVQLLLQLKSIEEVSSIGSSHFDLSALNEQQLTIFLEGAGNMRLSGRANEVSYQIQGTGKINAQHLQENDVEADIFGAGRLHVSVEHCLQVALTGVSKVCYSGHPVVHATAGPLATVTRKS